MCAAPDFMGGGINYQEKTLGPVFAKATPRPTGGATLGVYPPRIRLRALRYAETSKAGLPHRRPTAVRPAGSHIRGWPIALTAPLAARPFGGRRALCVSCHARGDTPQADAWGWKKLSPPRRLKYRRSGAAQEHLCRAPNGALALSRPAAFTFSSPRRKAWG